MDTIIRLLSEPVLGGIGLILSVVLGVLSYVFYRRQLIIKQPRFYVGAPYYPIERAFTTEGAISDVRYEIVIWNGGRGAISELDMVELDPLRVEAPRGTTFKGASLKSQRKAANDISVTLATDRRSARIQLRFLNWRDGAEIEVAIDGESRRTGPESRGGSLLDLKPRILGSVLGVESIKEVQKLKYVDEVLMSSIVGFIVLSIVVSLAFSIFAVFAFQVGVAMLGYLAPIVLLVVLVSLVCAAYYYLFYQDVPSGTERGRWVKGNVQRRGG